MSVSQEMLRASQKYGTEVRLIPDKPIPSKLTPRGPDEGISTRSVVLQAILIENASIAAAHPWWSENPDVFDGL